MSVDYLIFSRSFLKIFWHFFWAWKWLFWFFIVQKYFFKFWLYWRSNNVFKAKQKPIWLEIKLPETIVKPIGAMETVLSIIHKGFWEPARFWEKWWKGKGDAYDFQFEIFSKEGELHFYVRCYFAYKMDIFKAAIYSQYPQVEFKEVEDYSRAIPVDVPNKDWDMRAADFTLTKPDPYPIRTYTEMQKEIERVTPYNPEKIFDPMPALLEGMSMLGKGEQMWFQIKPFPIAGSHAEPYIKEGKRIIDKIVGRKTVKEESFFTTLIKFSINETGLFLKALVKVITDLILGAEKSSAPSVSSSKTEAGVKMTPRQAEICAAIERKLSKPLFMISTIRIIYLARRENFYYHRWREILEFMGSFAVSDMNSFNVIIRTFPKLVLPPPFNLIEKRWLYVRKRRILRLYQNRYEPRYPEGGDYKSGYFVLNTEELATVFHFVGRKIGRAPGVSWVEAKKLEAPPEVPMQ